MPAYVFGYGSLVHRGTHDYSDCRPARISGWRRAWCQAPSRSVPYLTAVPAAGHEIHGLIAEVGATSWAELDERERAYERHDVLHQLSADLPDGAEIVTYAVPHAHQSPPGPENGILLSYLDVCIAGYVDLMGDQGLQHFFDTTGNWTGPVVDDRANPIYPRHQDIGDELRARIDARISAMGLPFQDQDSLSWQGS